MPYGDKEQGKGNMLSINKHILLRITCVAIVTLLDCEQIQTIKVIVNVALSLNEGLL